MTVPYAIRHKLSLRPRTSTVCLCAQAAADTQERGFFFVSVVTSVWMKDLRCSPDTFLEVIQISLCLLVVLVCDAPGLDQINISKVASLALWSLLTLVLTSLCLLDPHRPDLYGDSGT